MNTAELYEELRRIAPSVAFDATREEYGYSPYDVDVTAKAIVGGKEIVGTASLGSSWYQPEEPLDDVHGYLPQMLVEAAQELDKQVPEGNWRSSLKSQIENAIAMLKYEMRTRWEVQQAERTATRS